MPHHTSLTEATPISEVKALFAQPPGPWPAGWEGLPNVCQAFREIFDAAARSLPAPPRWEAERGVVICAGGWRFFASLYVTVRMIRHVGCNLPIQVWYLGDRGEFDPRMQAALADYDVGWINGNAFARDHGLNRRILGGWELKPFAAAYCPFREVISLDADCYPAYNPEEFMAHPEFQRVGASFWPDQGKLEHGQWERFGIPYHDEPAWESGQFIVDKGRHWKPLALTMWLNDHSDFVYHHVYGDKDTFHLAWRKMGHEVCVPTAWPAWHVVAFLQQDFGGRPLFVHRCRDKFRWNGQIDGADVPGWYMTRQWHPETQFIEGLPHEQLAHDFCRESSELLRPLAHYKFTAPTDEGAWKECNLLNLYRLPPRMDGQTVIDIGGNCGGFSLAVLRRGAKRVICCEPFPNAAAVARENLAPYGERVEVRQVAVFDGSATEVELRGHDDKPDDSTNIAVAGMLDGRSVSLAPDGLSVSATTLDSLLKSCGRVDLLKLDCEGSEYPILSAATRLNQVGRITCEWHRASWNGRPWDATSLAELLTAWGWEVEYIVPTAPTHGTLFARNSAQ